MYNEVPILLWNLINPLGFLRAKPITRKRKRMGKIELNLKSKFIRIIKKSRDFFNIRSLQEIKSKIYSSPFILINCSFLEHNTVDIIDPLLQKPIISLSSSYPPLIVQNDEEETNIKLKLKQEKIKTRLSSNLHYSTFSVPFLFLFQRNGERIAD